MSDTIQLQSIQQLHSETANAKPSAENVEVGQLWVNLADNTIGSKKSDGTIVTYGQLTEEERDTLLSGGGVYVPKAGVVAGITNSSQGLNVDGDITINDQSEVTLVKTLAADGCTVTVNKTTGHKATKVVLTKPENVTCTITYTGIDDWLSTEAEPVFGESAEAQELCLAIFTSPTRVVANVVYNTENPTEVDLSGIAWGDITGTLSEQTDLNNALNAKADKSELVNYATSSALTSAIENASQTLAPKASPAFTGTATLNGQNVATVNQIPDVSHFVTDTALADYATTEIVTAEFESYDKTIKAHVESELDGYVTVSTYNSEKANFAKLDGAAFTGAVTVQEPTAASNPATKNYVDSAVASVYKYKGSVANQAALPQSGQVVGDVYNVEDTGHNFAWDGNAWDQLAGTVDLSGYLTTANAASTYLTKTDAQSTYQPVGDYATTTALNSGLAAKLDTTTAASTYATQTSVTQGLATKLDTDTYTTDKTTFALKTEIPNTNNFVAKRMQNEDNTEYTDISSSSSSLNIYVRSDTSSSEVYQSPSQIQQVVGNNTSKTRFTQSGSSGAYLLGIEQGRLKKALNIRLVDDKFSIYEAVDSVSVGSPIRSLVWDDGLADYAPLASPAFTGTATVGGKTVATTDQIPDVSTKVNLSGSRGTLAGYENTTVTSSALTINQTSPDSQQVTAAVRITVSNGSANTAWVKKVSIKNASATVSLGSSWSWVGGSMPTITAPSLLVLSWDNDCGMACMNTTG